MRVLSLLFLIIVIFYLNACGIYTDILKGMNESGFVVVLNVFKLYDFEKSVSCYYNQTNKFPANLDELQLGKDTLYNQKNIFLKINLDSNYNRSSRYYFELLPFTTSFDDSSNLFVDSIKILQCFGNISFNDSLLTSDYDSLIAL